MAAIVPEWSRVAPFRNGEPCCGVDWSSHGYQNHVLTWRIVRVHDSTEPPRVKLWAESKTEWNRASLCRLEQVRIELRVCIEFASLVCFIFLSSSLLRVSIAVLPKSFRFSFFLLALQSVVPSLYLATVGLWKRRQGAHAWCPQPQCEAEVRVTECVFLLRPCECVVAVATVKCVAATSQQRWRESPQRWVRWPETRFSTFPLLFVGLTLDWRILWMKNTMNTIWSF